MTQNKQQTKCSPVKRYGPEILHALSRKIRQSNQGLRGFFGDFEPLDLGAFPSKPLNQENEEGENGLDLTGE
jgi:hypothetical protein